MMRTILLLTVLTFPQAWVYAEIPWPEHPRPDFERAPWVNLNGPWSFAFDPDDAGVQAEWFKAGVGKLDRKIVVPFPWESELSGIHQPDYKGVAWYAREVELPSGPGWEGKNAWLVIGACDFEAKVWIDGQLACEHAGGYLPFEVNLSRFGKPGQRVTVVVRAVDRTDWQQPIGKQVDRWYTRTSGIWQTVYIEPRSAVHIRAMRTTPDVESGTVLYEIEVNKEAPAHTVAITSPEGAFEPAGAAYTLDAKVIQVLVKVRDPQAWSPDSPKLYPAVLTLRDVNNHPIDEVRGYFGLREISTGKAPDGDFNHVQLNGKPIYLRGALHQSFHPKGIYQYPDDAAARADYEIARQLGLNFLRIHIKVPTPRELYWADKLGVLIMEDMPSFWRYTPQAQAWWQDMARGAIARDCNHPAVFAWILFNETWGIGDGGYKPDRQAWVEGMYWWAKKLDPTRLVEDNSPCSYDHVATDINSWHFYINSYSDARRHIREVVEKTYPGSTFNFAKGYEQNDAPLMNSEYGGIGAGSGDQDVSWCFKFLTNELRRHDKIGGYVYTELCDIEWEHNGFVNYDRTPKEFGYGFWFPGFSPADLNNADFVALNSPPMIELAPMQDREVGVEVSHWSDRKAANLALRWRVDWLDRFGRRFEGQWEQQPAEWRSFEVVEQPGIRGDRRIIGFAAIPGAVHRIGQRIIARVRLPPDLPRHEIDHRARRRGDQSIQNRIVRLLLRRPGKGIERSDVRIIDAADRAVGAVDLAQIGTAVDTAAQPLDERRIEPGEIGHPGHDAVRRFRIGAAAQQVPREIAARIGFHFGHRGRGEPMLPLEVRRRHRRQVDHPGQRRQGRRAIARRWIEIGGDHDEASDANTDLRLELIGDARRAVAAIAFAHQIFGRPQPPFLDQPVVHDLREIFDIGIVGVEGLLGLRLIDQASAEPRADRIDEDEIGEIEPAVGVVASDRRVRRRIAPARRTGCASAPPRRD